VVEYIVSWDMYLSTIRPGEFFPVDSRHGGSVVGVRMAS
jgi:hypothetical protein